MKNYDLFKTSLIGSQLACNVTSTVLFCLI